MSKTLLYYLGVTSLLTHELDAVLNTEWRLLYVLRTLSDDVASLYFVAMHFVIIFAFFYFGHHQKSKVEEGFRGAVALFLIVHGILHFRLSDDPLYTFSGLSSNLYIYGASAFGLLFLLMQFNQKKTANLDSVD